MSLTMNPENAPAARLRRRGLWLLALCLAALIACTSAVFVDETEFVIVENLGRIVAVYDRAVTKLEAGEVRPVIRQARLVPALAALNVTVLAK